MDKRILVKICVSSDSTISLRTISRGFKSPQRFVILKKELQKLEQERWLVSVDIHSFAKLRLCKSTDGLEIMEINFTWLQSDGWGNLSGRTEAIQLPYAPFREFASGGIGEGKEWSALSILSKSSPRLEFHSRRNLHAVAANPLLRNKLGRFFAREMHWTDYQRIVLSDDFLPYSFFFTCYTHSGPGLCGGVILHGQDNLQKAYYGLHT